MVSRLLLTVCPDDDKAISWGIGMRGKSIVFVPCNWITLLASDMLTMEVLCIHFIASLEFGCLTYNYVYSSHSPPTGRVMCF